MKDSEDKKENLAGKTWLKKVTKPYLPSIVFLTVLTVATTFFSLSFSFNLQYIINSAADQNKKKLFLFLGLGLLFVALRVLSHTLTSYFAEKYRAKMVVGLRNRIFSKVLCASYSSTEKYHSGDLVTRMTSDVQEVVSDSVYILPAIAGMVVQCVGAASALLVLDPLFTAVFTLGGALLGGVSALFRKYVKKFHKEQVEADGKCRSFMQEGIASLLTVKAYGVEEKSSEKSKGILGDYFQKRMKKNRMRVGMQCAFSFMSSASLVFAVAWCSIRVMNGNADYGSIMSVVMLLGQLQQPFSSFAGLLPLMYARQASGERLAEIDDMPAEEQGKDNCDELYAQMPSIRFENVSFTYGRNPIFTQANATVEKGNIVCIVGESGSGKSTLFKLLLSVYAPQEGALFAGERKLTAGERGLFAYVPQGNFLFSGTIYENMSFFAEGERTITKEEVEEALRLACADFVWELPEGLNTSLKERGGGLSEGQLQRLAIARAILSNRPILLLDEATSALDSETEKAVLENIRKVQGKTCLIVTHRPAALDIADRILSVDGGQLRFIK